MVNVAHTDMGAKEIVENILAASKVLAKRYPGGWKNIRSLQIKAEKTIAIPAYVSLTSGNDIGFVDSDAPARVRREAVTGDLSTQPGMEITVLPAGKIKITKKKDPEWDDEKDEPFNEDSENEEDKEAADKKEEEKKKKKTAVKRKKEEEGEKKDDKKKSKKKKNAQEEEEDSEDEEMQDAEMKYMQKVAEEEEAIEAKEESKKDKKEGANDEESEGEEEENDEEESGEEGEESELDSDDVLVDEDSDDDESEEDDDKQLILRKKSAGSSDEEDSDWNDYALIWIEIKLNKLCQIYFSSNFLTSSIRAKQFLHMTKTKPRANSVELYHVDIYEMKDACEINLANNYVLFIFQEIITMPSNFTINVFFCLYWNKSISWYATTVSIVGEHFFLHHCY